VRNVRYIRNTKRKRRERVRRQIVYIAGQYRSKYGVIGRIINIWKARKAAIRLWQRGYVTICPHLNTMLFDGHCPDDIWLKGDIKILKHCDIIFLLKGWDKSAGARQEFIEAALAKMRVMFEGDEKIYPPFKLIVQDDITNIDTTSLLDIESYKLVPRTPETVIDIKEDVEVTGI
jgi:hypothetical protein